MKKPMQEIQNDFFRNMNRMKKLNMASLHKGITNGEFFTICAIKDLRKKKSEDEIRVSDIIKSVRAPAPAVSRDLKNLESKGIVERYVDKNDRRNTIVIITDKGEKMIEETKERMNLFSERVFGSLGEENFRLLNQTFGKLVDAAERELEKVKGEDLEKVKTEEIGNTKNMEKGGMMHV